VKSLVTNMSSLLTSIDRTIGSLNTLSQNIRSRILENPELNVKVASVAASMRELVDSIATGMLQLKKYLETVNIQEGVAKLAPFTYLVVRKDKIILLRSRPEYVVLSLEPQSNVVEVKSRESLITIAPGRIALRAGGISVEIDPLNPSDYQARRNELRNLLRHLGKTVGFRFTLLVEQYVGKKTAKA